MGLKRLIQLAVLLAAVVCPLGAALAESPPVPRMVSLRADEVNVRSGPSLQYPVMWVFRRKLMPVEIVAEYDHWRKIRDWEGAEGWVHRAMLTGVRSVVTLDEVLTMRQDPSDDAPAVARLKQGIVARVSECGKVWCYVSTHGYDGWIKRVSTWGLYPSETID